MASFWLAVSIVVLLLFQMCTVDQLDKLEELNGVDCRGGFIVAVECTPLEKE